VVLLLIDAIQGVTDQDAHIAGYVLESGRSVVVAVKSSGGSAIRRARGRYVVGQQQQGLTQNQQPNGD
jgi:predicted GTPase